MKTTILTVLLFAFGLVVSGQTITGIEQISQKILYPKWSIGLDLDSNFVLRKANEYGGFDSLTIKFEGSHVIDLSQLVIGNGISELLTNPYGIAPSRIVLLNNRDASIDDVIPSNAPEWRQIPGEMILNVPGEVPHFNVTEPYFKKLSKDYGSYLKQHKWILAIRFTKGLARGYRECLLANPDKFVDCFPIGSDEWKDPRQSWRRKWKNGDPGQGEAFFGSTSFLVGVTDAKHGLASYMTIAEVGADILTVAIYIGKKTTWREIGFNAVSSLAAELLGTNVAYHALCNQPLFKGKSGQ